jgi:hypothetical protein
LLVKTNRKDLTAAGQGDATKHKGPGVRPALTLD